MKLSVKEIADIVGGTVHGLDDIVISELSKIEEAKNGSLSFIANEKYNHFISKTSASALIIGKNFEIPQDHLPTLIKVDDPYLCFATILNIFNKKQQIIKGIHPSAIIETENTIDPSTSIGANVFIGKECKIGKEVVIHPNCTIGNNVTIKDYTILYPSVNIYQDCLIGKNCIVQSGVIIGADGFGFASNSENKFDKVAQIGNVIIEDHVEIGSNTTIDRATMGSTIIREGVKLDNLIQVAHNVEIGKNTIIAAQTGIAGSTKIGQNCMIGGQVGIVGHLQIGDNVKIAAQSGISSNISDNNIVQGSPAFSISDYKRAYVYFKKLPQLNLLVNKIEKQLNTLLSK